MIDDTKPQGDPAVAEELQGVPNELFENDDTSGGNERVADLERQLDEARQEVLYAKAETQNVRRRLEKDIADARSYAATSFARDILSVSDNLARALEAIPAELRQDDKLKSVVAGIEATGRELDKVFSLHGITRIAAQGLPLDPHQHQAMLEVPSAEAEPGTIVQELQPGYMIKGRLLRPAMVAVAKKPE
ncbi:MAG: nucleotide exchange factor GrpE [Novosphingobium sp.]|nr:nucleotide exchange factor GrpE [Novosphingobium sp.]